MMGLLSEELRGEGGNIAIHGAGGGINNTSTGVWD